jgi:hypothetical protein
MWILGLRPRNSQEFINGIFLAVYLNENNGVGPEARHPKDGKAGIHDGNTHLKPKR